MNPVRLLLFGIVLAPRTLSAASDPLPERFLAVCGCAEGKGRSKGALLLVGRNGKSCGRFSLRSGPVCIRRDSRGVRISQEGRWLAPPKPLPELRHLSLVSDPGAWSLRIQPLGELLWEDDFMRGQGELGEWEVASGIWESAGPPLSRFHVNAFSFRGKAAESMEGRASAGYDFWDDLSISCSLRRQGEQDAGVLFGDASQFSPGPFLVSLSGQLDRGRVCLRQRRGDRWETLGEEPYPCLVNQWHRLNVKTDWNGVTVVLDRLPLLRVEIQSVKAGRIGLWVEGESWVEFDDVRVSDLDLWEAMGEHRLLPRAFEGPFSDDPYMSKWSQEASYWEKVEKGFQHTGLFFGEVELSLNFPSELKSDSWTRFRFVDDREEGPESQIVSQKKIERTEKKKPSARAVWTGKAGRGSRLGLQGNWDPRSFLELKSESVRDYTFRKAPVDWFILGGAWTVQSRWACTPRWNWFGGKGADRVGILHKEVIAGDCMVDAFCAFKMDTNFFPIYEHPGDINVSLCVRGSNLDSGYSFLYGGWGNRRTAILKGTQVLAERDDLLLPDNRDRTQTVTDIHKPWYRVRAEKREDFLRFYVEDTLALEAKDPAPLEGGRVALWSFEQGLMVARARIYGKGETVPLLKAEAHPPKPLRRPSFRGGESLSVGSWKKRTPETVAQAFKESQETLMVRTPWGGGRMLVGPPDWEPREALGARLAFHYKKSEDALFHLYVKANDWWCCFPLVRKETRLPEGIVLSQVPSEELERGWRRCVVDLGETLAEVFPDAGSIQVQDMVFGNKDNSGYELCGFEWNRANASYTIDDLKWIQKNVPVPPTRASSISLSPLYSGTLYGGFEKSWDGVKRFGGEDGALLLRDVNDPFEGRFCLRLTNPKLGGTAGCVLVDEPFSAKRYPVFRFAYKMDEEARLDLVLETSSGERQIRFADTDHTWPLIGTVADVHRDMEWHEAEIPLLDCLQGSFGKDLPIIYRILLISTGWPGNRRNSTVRLDSIGLEGVPLQKNGQAEEPPKVTPEAGKSAMPERVKVRFQREGTSLDPASFRLLIGERIYDLSDSTLSWDGKDRSLTWDVHQSERPAGIPEEGTLLKASFHWATEGGAPRHISWNWSVSREKDREAPPPPWVSVIPEDLLVRYDFEKDRGTWGNFIHCRTLLHCRGCGTGRSCMELRPLMSKTRVAAMIRELDYDVGRYPMIYLEHRMEGASSSVPLELLGVAYDGTHDSWPLIETLTVEPSWQRTAIDLEAAIRAITQKNKKLSLRRLSLGHRAGLGAQETLRYFVDNVCIAGVPTDTVSFEWNAPVDLSGIKGYAVVIDRKEDTVPQEKLTEKGHGKQFQGNPGVWWFHIRAVDGAENWSAPSHTSFVLGRGLENPSFPDS